MQLGPEHFPALPGSARKSGVTEGYAREFAHYSREQMAAFVKTMTAEQRSKPEALQFLTAAAQPAVHRSAPLQNSQLLAPFPMYVSTNSDGFFFLNVTWTE